MSSLENRVKRLEDLASRKGLGFRPTLCDFIDTAEGRMNCRRLLRPHFLRVIVDRVPSDPDYLNDVRKAEEILGEDSPEREAADIAEADRMETERVGHTEWRRWSGWRQVLAAESFYRSDLEQRGEEFRGAAGSLRGKHWDEFYNSEHWPAFSRKEPGALGFNEYHERRCREYLDARRAREEGEAGYHEREQKARTKILDFLQAAFDREEDQAAADKDDPEARSDRWDKFLEKMLPYVFG